MLTWLSVVLLGFFLGMRHATDPDHVIAVSTIVSRERRVVAASAVGVLWGVGHTLTIMVVGGAIVLLGVVIPPRVGLTMELLTAAMLVVLGVLSLKAGLAEGVAPAGGAAEGARHEGGLHSHAHTHGDYVHSHPHAHGAAAHGHAEDRTPQARLDRLFGRLGLYQVVRPLVVGVVHGLAGSAAVALLVLATIPHPGWAVAYLLVFGLGTIAGMMLITAVIAVPLAYTAARFARVHRALALTTGLASFALGVVLAYQVGFVGGLFLR